MKFLFLPVLLCLLGLTTQAQAPQSIYCINSSYRNWWDVQHYALKLDIPTGSDTIQGTVAIKAVVKQSGSDTLQIDLQAPLQISSISINNIPGSFTQQGNAYLVPVRQQLAKGDTFTLNVRYKGAPILAKKAPWDGGFVRQKDEQGYSWIAVACQGIGASVWFPCKDFPGDEPNLGADLYYATEPAYTAVGNGKLIGSRTLSDRRKEWHWQVKNPINLYDITFYIGNYTHWSDTLQGLKGTLPLEYYVLRHNEAKARKQFAVVKPMLHAFESWMGPYPFYEDDYKLVDAPYLGMEHQSAVAYGNEYKMGYLGRDRSKTGAGLLFDFIIVHESGHEWYGNNISINDVAYSWIHEGYTTYTETLLAESLFGKEKAYQYQRGCWQLIRNDSPMEGKPGQCDGGSGDHYVKGSAMIHMIRTILNNDQAFRKLLTGMNQQFWHQSISGADMEAFLIRETRLPLQPIFDQYLRTTQVPHLVLRKNAKGFTYQWESCIPGFNMPVLVYINKKPLWLHPVTRAQQYNISKLKKVSVSPDFYIQYTGLE